MSGDSPDWVRCVAHHSSGKTWCGRLPDERSFVSLEQALGSNGSHRLMICDRCSDKVKAALKAVSYNPGRLHRPARVA